MPGDAAKSLTDNSRIVAWRQDRLRVAEQEKEERLRKRDEARKMLELERKRLRRETARALLPETDENMAIAEERAQQATRARLHLIGQFAMVVLAPVVIAAWYLLAFATPLYEARAVVSIAQSSSDERQTVSGLAAGLNASGTLREAFMAHEFIRSQGLLDVLEEEQGFITRYSSAQMDPARRLYALPRSGIEQRRQSTRFIDSSIDVQSGLLTLYVRAIDPQEAITTAALVLDRTGAQINALIDEMHAERIALAQATLAKAEQEMAEAQAEIIRLQISGGEVDPQMRVVSLYQTIDDLEQEVRSLQTEVQKAEFSGMSDTLAARQTATLKSNVEAEIAALRERLVAPSGTTGLSLNALVIAFERAQLELGIARDGVAAALAALGEAEKAAALGRSQFQVVVAPQTDPVPRYPQIPGTLALVFIFCLTLFGFWRLISAGRRSMA